MRYHMNSDPPTAPKRCVPRKQNAMRRQVQQRQAANVSLLLPTEVLEATQEKEKSRTSKRRDGRRWTMEMERIFVRGLRQKVGEWGIDLWLDNDYLRGNIGDASSKNAAEAALKLEIERKVRQALVCSMSGFESKPTYWQQLKATEK